MVAAAMLFAGYFFIRRHNTEAHKACMLSALLAFLASMGAYAVHKYSVGTIKFAGIGALKTFYFIALYGHAMAASFAMPLAGMALYRAFREDFSAHKKIAVWALPVWFFSSVTGVIVYYILFHTVQRSGL